jgi:hypothetical protein
MAKASEDFFQQQTRWVLDAMKRRTLETVDSVKKNTDVRPWIRQRPTTSVLAAAAGGLVAGFLATPNRRATEARRAKAVEQALRHAGQQQRHHSFASHLETEVFRTLRPALRAFAASAAGMLFANVHMPFGQPQGQAGTPDMSGFPRSGMQI